ncbi:MAG: galactose mutarotase, partial [Paracoccaceae bacterium]|nr:galactose mutarotase [Paracoccaceae bacterium]
MAATHLMSEAVVRTHQMGGETVHEIILRNDAGATASILSWGAVLRDLRVPLKDGTLRRVVLSYADITDYAANAPYLGTVIGRVCNRIAHGHFVLDGAPYQVPVNGPGEVHLHGGIKGFTRRNWSLEDCGRNFVVLALVSPDGDEGYPGTVSVRCRYELTGDCTLRMQIDGTTDAPTLLNMTNHSYFTLTEGAKAGDHWLQVDADLFTPTESNQIPTGEVLRVDATPFDFRTGHQIGASGADYEVNFILKAPRNHVRQVAR